MGETNNRRRGITRTCVTTNGDYTLGDTFSGGDSEYTSDYGTDGGDHESGREGYYSSSGDFIEAGTSGDYDPESSDDKPSDGDTESDDYVSVD